MENEIESNSVSVHTPTHRHTDRHTHTRIVELSSVNEFRFCKLLMAIGEPVPNRTFLRISQVNTKEMFPSIAMHCTSSKHECNRSTPAKRFQEVLH